MKQNFDEIIKLGQMLKNAREKKQVSIKQASQATKIRLDFLQALESSSYSYLPAKVYTKGFIRNYAKYLGINPETALAFYRRENEESVKEVEPKQPSIFQNKFTKSLTINRQFIIIAVSVLVVLIFGGYILTRVGSVVQAPEFSINSPVEISAGSLQEYTTTEETINITGRIQVGSTLTLNDSKVDTKNLEIFEIPDYKITNGENTLNFVATSEFGVTSEIVLIINKESTSQTPTPEIIEEPEEEVLEEMFIEIIVGPRDANLLVEIDGNLTQNNVETADTVKTFKAESSLVIQTPRPDSVRVAINGEEQIINSADRIEWKIIEGQVIRSR